MYQVLGVPCVPDGTGRDSDRNVYGEGGWGARFGYGVTQVTRGVDLSPIGCRAGQLPCHRASSSAVLLYTQWCEADQRLPLCLIIIGTAALGYVLA